MGRALAGSSIVVEGEDSASELPLAVTRWFVKSLLDVEPVVVPSSADHKLSVAAGGLLPADVEALGPEVERLSVSCSSPQPKDVCVGTTATVAEDGVIAAAGQVVLAVQTEGRLCVVTELSYQVKHCVLCKYLT